jgi:hypothetical protein
VKKLFAKCPKCGAEVKVKGIYEGLFQGLVEGDCIVCKIHFTTATFWEEK